MIDNEVKVGEGEKSKRFKFGRENEIQSFCEEVENLQIMLSESCSENYDLKLENVQLKIELQQKEIKQDLDLSNLQMKLKLMEEALNKSNAQTKKLKPLPLLLEK